MNKPQLKGLSKRALLIILDGYGINQQNFKNAIKDAHKPFLDDLFEHYPFTTIQSGGEAVGLPKGVVGNSEVGHINIGAGRPVRQDLSRINEAIQKDTFKNLPKFQELIEVSKSKTKRIHLLGLLSDGGVHSHIEHLKYIINVLNEYPDLKVFVHAFMDGRDTQKNKGIKFIQELLKLKNVHIASLQGRSIGMDRDRRWEKIEHCYKTLIGQEKQSNLSPEEYIQKEYDQNIYDEFITPALLTPDGAIKENDSVFFINFRPDRAKQITLAMNDPSFNHFPIPVKCGHFLCMSPYVDEELPNLPVLLDKEKVKPTLSEYISSLGFQQFKIAETEKFAHVTYFINGGEQKAFPGEERCLVPSPRQVKTYDQLPQMSAPEVTQNLIAAIGQEKYRLLIVNYANADMVGHTGNYPAAIKAIETLDECIHQVIKKCQEEGVTAIVTADHGNSDQMCYEDGSPHTSHTGAPVPFVVFSPSLRDSSIKPNPGNFSLKDIAPTLLNLMGLDYPEQMTGTPIFG